MTISLLARACFFGGGGGSTGCASSVGAEPSPSHATGAPDAGAQSVPKAQQFASISAAQKNKMDFEIIAITLRRCNQERKKKMSWYRFFRFDGIKTGLQTSDLRRFPDVNLKCSGAAGAAPVPLSGRAARG